MDRDDLARLSLEERVSAVEELRRIWFGENPAESGLVRVLIALDRERSAVVVVGGHAVAAHGEPRLTEDLDVFVDASAANAVRLRRALVAFGFGEQAPPEADLAKPGNVWMLGRKPWRIDILTRIDGVTFAQVWEGRVEAEFVSKPLYVIGRAELIANKRAAARDKDLSDAERLEALGPLAKRGKRARGARKVPAPGAKGPRRQRPS